MSGVEKENGTGMNSTHCFPSIQPSAGDDSDQGATADFAFRPLYQNPTSIKDSHPADYRNNHNLSENIPLKEDKGESFNKGFEAGKAEACKIVQQELDVPIRQFRNETHCYQDAYTRITEPYSDHIVQLAMAIAKNILGSHVELNIERLEPISRHLQSYLGRHYRLNMKLNHYDFKSMSDIMACEDPLWHQSTALHITGDESTPKGQIDGDPLEAACENPKEDFFGELEALLSQPPPA